MRSIAVLEYYLVGYRRRWRSTVFSAFIMPVLFLLGLGLSVGAYVDRSGGLDIPYHQFVGSGLLAFTSVQIAMTESSLAVLSRFKWLRTYHGMGATPLRARDIVAGQLWFIALRIAVAAAAFVLVMALLGGLGSSWAVLAPAVAVLLGLAVAGPMCALSASIESGNTLNAMFRLALLPMMLFSGVFFPIEQLPELLVAVAYALPLWHGVELCRVFILGTEGGGPVPVHLGYLGLWVVVGFGLSTSRFRRRLTN